MVTLCIQSETKAGRAGNLRKLQPALRTPDETTLAGLAIDEGKRLQQLLSRPCRYVRHPSFGRMRDLTDLRGGTMLQGGALADAETPAAVRPGTTTVLSAEQERRLFHRFNYCRYRAFRLLRRHRGQRLGCRAIRELLRWDRIAEETRAAIVEANTPLVLAMASRARDCGVDLADLISEGNLALLRSVDSFDCSLGYKFSTYACNAIRASFSLAGKRWARYHAHYLTGLDQFIHLSDCLDPQREHAEIEGAEELRQILLRNGAGLSAVERRVLHERFSLNVLGKSEPPRPHTLEEIGTELGVSKERVRQLQKTALGRLRAKLDWQRPMTNAIG